MREGWEYKKLKEIGQTQTGTTPSKSVKSYYGGEIPFIRPAELDIDGNGSIEYNSELKLTPEGALKSRMISANSILMCCIGSVGKTGYSIKDVTCNQQINTITPYEGYNSKFVYYALLTPSFQNEVIKIANSAKVTLAIISKGKWEEMSIPVPSLSTQESIVSELDKINELISLKKEQLKDYDNLAQSIFYDMFGDPITNEKGWEVKKYGDCFAIGSGGTPSKSNPLYWDNGNIPWIGSNMCQNCIITETDGKYITSEGLKNSSAKMLDPGTVLVALVGATIGKVALLRISTSTNQNIAFIKVNENKLFFPEFVYYHLMNQYDEFMLIGNGDFKMANQAFIKSLTIMMPPLSLQQAFAKRIEAIEQQKQLISSEIKDLETLLASRMQYWFD